MNLTPAISLTSAALLLVPGGLFAIEPASQPASRADEIDRLVDKWTPEADNWQTEIDADHAGKQLNALAAHLAESRLDAKLLEAFFAKDAQCTSLAVGRAQSHARQGISIQRSAVTADADAKFVRPADALRELMQIHAGGRDIHIKFKIVSVSPGAKGSFSTDVYFQSDSLQPDGHHAQQNAEWTIDWARDTDHAVPHIRGIRAKKHTSVQWPGRAFTDCTRGVIQSDADWFPQLALGGDYWYGRIDAVGEINFMGHNGIAVGDVNNDGLDDLYVAQSTGIPNKLFIQQPDGSVRETANDAGVAWLDDTKGVLLLDLDNDGDQDLLCAIGPTIVYCRNDGTGKFKPFRSLRAASPASFYSLAAADFDLDGDLDIYACRYVKLRYGTSVPIPFHDANNGPSNHLLRNDGEKGFTDVTQEAGLDVNNARFSLAASWADYDDDGDPDLYVANDFGRNNLYRNDEGRFTDIAAEAGVEDQAAGMGASWADYDRDGDLDLYVSNMFSSAGRRIAYQSRFMQNKNDDSRQAAQHHSLGNSLFANLGNSRFKDVSDRCGVRVGRWAWGAGFVDFNNDGFEDIVVPNGFLTNQYKDDL